MQFAASVLGRAMPWPTAQSMAVVKRVAKLAVADRRSEGVRTTIGRRTTRRSTFSGIATFEFDAH